MDKKNVQKRVQLRIEYEAKVQFYANRVFCELLVGIV